MEGSFLRTLRSLSYAPEHRWLDLAHMGLRNRLTCLCGANDGQTKSIHCARLDRATIEGWRDANMRIVEKRLMDLARHTMTETPKRQSG